jgi:hypothetical protein
MSAALIGIDVIFDRPRDRVGLCCKKNRLGKIGANATLICAHCGTPRGRLPHVAVTTIAAIVTKIRAVLKGEQTMSNSPTFVATFDDGEITRMTVHQRCVDELDVGRGVRLARHAYNSRKRNSRKRTATPPPIKAAHYENGEHLVLRTYTAEELTTL